MGNRKYNVGLISSLIILVCVAIIGYPMNLNTFIWSWSSPSMANFMISLAFLLAWLLFLFFIVKKTAKKLLRLYLIYWLLSVLFIAAYPLAVSMIIPPFIFWVPLIGVGYPLIGMSNVAVINVIGTTPIAIFLCSVLMSLPGIYALYKQR